MKTIRRVLARVRVADRDLDPAGHGAVRVLVQDADELDRRLRADLGADVLRDQPGQIVELLGEDRRRRVGGLGVVAVAAARVGHRRQQILVEAVAEADRGRADPVAAGAGGEPDERGRVGDPDVGEAVGEQEDLPDSFGALELLESFQPAAGEVGLTAGTDRPEPPERGAAVTGASGTITRTSSS